MGTSGYSFADWVGPFYPPGTRSGDFLAHYARHFPAVEVNATYYRVPPPAAMAAMERKTPPGFRFMVKVNQAMTHERLLEPALVRDFRAALAPLKDAGKFDGLLAQFPWGFRRTRGERGAPVAGCGTRSRTSRCSSSSATTRGRAPTWPAGCARRVSASARWTSRRSTG